MLQQPRYRYNRWCRRHWGASCVATWWCWGLAKNRMESRWAEEQSAAVNQLNCLALVYEILWISTIWDQKQNAGIGPGWFPYRSWQFCEYLQTTSDSTRVLWKNRIFFSNSHMVIIFKSAIFCISSLMCIFLIGSYKPIAIIHTNPTVGGTCCSGLQLKKGGGWMKVVIETIHKSCFSAENCRIDGSNHVQPNNYTFRSSSRGEKLVVPWRWYFFRLIED